MATEYESVPCPGGEECRHWGNIRERNSPNVHTYPYNDTVLHVATERCVCGPRWEAVWDRRARSVVWQFVHHSADGRERHEQAAE